MSSATEKSDKSRVKGKKTGSIGESQERPQGHYNFLLASGKTVIYLPSMNSFALYNGHMMKTGN